ncbi:MAG: hypothetical protein L0Y45_03930, partial [Woeseiaceae bacterium]|nr:hypothetical protein [Woeseiaceae bacterium]
VQPKPAPATPARSIPVPQEVIAARAETPAESKADTTITEIPAWDRDPTLAELKPDIEALEAALAVVPEPAGKTDPKPPAKPITTKPNGKAAVHNFDLPEITLEKELQVKEIEAQQALRKTSPPDTHEADLEVKVKRKHGFDLDRLAAELGKARSLEDVDDKLAETLFGEEMAQAAAEIAALVAADTDAKNLAAKEVTGTSRPAAAAPVANKPEGMVPPAVTAAKPAARVAASSPAVSHQPNAKSAGPKPGVPGSPAAGAARVAVTPGNTLAPKGPAVEITLGNHPEHSPAAPAATPEPIENQFGTSMTATLKALSAAQIKQLEGHDKEDPDASEPEDKGKPSRRLFGFFRSST